ncbi:substrate-binding domain-containing protein [Kitasatospora sp. RG8]|uniref:substrate-binding domain-containing protein n=1 Tax=Kitasatospora sp. RG8 TaxID=2820815 RepID=UPI001ADF74D5|nr:substrate-binding domain-containing protein [Kitasatospora sp. RG8]MBP0453788.1 substrate-binding domain-containing protein [Kitasatospora sp. RG8]
MRKTAAKLLAVAAIATSVATVASGTALADPTVTPAAQDIVSVGSDTTQAVSNQFSTDYNAYLTSIGDTTSPRYYSWDATGSATITPKSGATSIPRPNGSGAGISALNATGSQVDVARSSRGPKPNPGGDPTTDVFVAFAKDAVSWSAPSGGYAPANLTTAQLKAIYECTTTDWHTLVPAVPAGTTIKPYLPQANSGTRSFFLSAIGNPALGGCVVTGPQENEGTDPVFTNAASVFPYSVAHYIGQVFNGHSSGSDAAGTLTIRSVDGVSPLTATNTLSPAFAATAYGRVVYNVVRQAEWTATDAHGTALRNIFGPASTNGWICKNGTNDIKSYGFLPLPGAACGSTIQNNS